VALLGAGGGIGLVGSCLAGIAPANCKAKVSARDCASHTTNANALPLINMPTTVSSLSIGRTARFILPCLGRAGVVPIAALVGAQRHRVAAPRTEPDVREEGRAAHYARR